MKTVAMLIAILAGTACGSNDGGGIAGNTLRRDSAGIAIVESSGPASVDSLVPWRITESPSVSIGQAEGNAEYELFRVQQATRLGSGQIVIANSGTHQLRYYGGNGVFQFAVGSEGYGPGEFKDISWLSRFSGDSLLVFDGRQYRFTVLDANGKIIRDFIPAPMLDGLSYPVAMINDRRLVVVNGHPMSSNVPGVQKEYGTYLITDLMGAVIDTLGSFPIDEKYVQFRGPIRSTTRRPFSATTSVAAHRDRIYVAVGDSHVIEVLDTAGVHIMSMRVPRPRPKVTERGIEQYIAQRSKTREFRSAVGSGSPEDLPFPEEYPLLSQLVADPTGHIWARDYITPERYPVWWHIHTERGAWLGNIAVPAGMKIYEVGHDYVLGLVMDQYGVEQVRVYGLRR